MRMPLNALVLFLRWINPLVVITLNASSWCFVVLIMSCEIGLLNVLTLVSFDSLFRRLTPRSQVRASVWPNSLPTLFAIFIIGNT